MRAERFYATVFLSFLSAASAHAAHVESGPLTINGQNGTVIENKHITSTSGPCITITNSTNITIHNSEIGPCNTNDANSLSNGQAFVITGGSGIKILDSYIHAEARGIVNKTSNQIAYDVGDNILCTNSSNMLIQGNVIAWGESNIVLYCNGARVTGNFLVNPIASNNKYNRGQQVAIWEGSTGAQIDRNYTVASYDTDAWKYRAFNGDQISGANTAGGFSVTNNYVTGGTVQSSCGINMDGGNNQATSAAPTTISNNTVVDGGLCGVSIEGGYNYTVNGNKILDRYVPTLQFAGNSNGIQIFQCYAGDVDGSACRTGQIIPCGNISLANNISYGENSSRVVAGLFAPAGFAGCTNVTGTANGANGNIYDSAQNGAAYNALTPVATKIPPPLIPPVPYSCTVVSPYTTQTSNAACDGSSSAAPQVPVVTPPSVQTSVVGSAVAITIAASNSPTSYSAKIHGGTGLPPGLALSGATISGTPTQPGTYTIDLTAANASGTSPVVTLTLTVSATATKSNSNLITATLLRAVPAAGNSVALSWTYDSSNVTGFRILRRITEIPLDLFVPVGQAPATATTFTDNGPLNAGWTYTYEVIAFNGSGDALPSLPSTIQVGNQPPLVSMTSPADNQHVAWGSTVVLSANASVQTAGVGRSIVKVDFYQDANLLGTATSPPYNFTWTNPDAGTYSLTAVASDNTKASTISDPVTVIVDPKPTATPTAPSLLRAASLSTNAVALNWKSGASTAAGFRIKRRTTEIASDSFVEIGQAPATASSYTDNGPLNVGWTYTYEVIAFNVIGDGLPSNTATIFVGAQPPTVSLTAPPDNQHVASGATVTLSANASVQTGAVGRSITKVDFYQNGNLLGSATSSPYSFTWTNAASGTYALTAVASDNTKASTISDPVALIVDPKPTTPPTAVAGLRGATAPPKSVALTWQAAVSTAAGFRIKRHTTEIANDPFVEIGQAPATVSGFIDNSPLNSGWVYTYEVVAFNAVGDALPSNLATVLVGNSPPVISITAPDDGQHVAAGSVALSATASAPDKGTITQVDFYQGTNLLGTAKSSPYNFTWTNAPAGTYVLTAVVTENSKVNTISDPVVIIVDAPGTTPPPTASITTPGKNATVSGAVAVAAVAAGNVAVSRVELDVDGNLAATDTFAPYNFTWDSTGVANGAHTLTVQAYGATGNAGPLGAAVTVTVKNSATLPINVSCNNNSGDAGLIQAKLNAGGTVAVGGTCNLGGTTLTMGSNTTLAGSATLNYSGGGYALQSSGNNNTVTGLTFNGGGIELTLNDTANWTGQNGWTITQNNFRNITNGNDGVHIDSILGKGGNPSAISNNTFSNIWQTGYPNFPTGDYTTNACFDIDGEAPCVTGSGIYFHLGIDNTVIDGNTFDEIGFNAVKGFWDGYIGNNFAYVGKNFVISNNTMTRVRRIGMEMQQAAQNLCPGGCNDNAMATDGTIIKNNFYHAPVFQKGNFAYSFMLGGTHAQIINNTAVTENPTCYWPLGIAMENTIDGGLLQGNVMGAVYQNCAGGYNPTHNWGGLIVPGYTLPGFTDTYQNNIGCGDGGTGKSLSNPGEYDPYYRATTIEQGEYYANSCPAGANLATSDVSITFPSASNNQTIAKGGNGTWNVSVVSNLSIKSVQFYIDGSGTPAVTQEVQDYNANFGATRAWLYHAALSVANYANGSHTIKAVTTDVANTSQSATANFTVGGANSSSVTPPSVLTPDASAVKVYPNPWRVDHHAGHPVTFANLPAGSSVKIYTVAGYWIKTLSESGGAATWDVKTDGGDWAASGIYLYLVNSNSQNIKGKLVIVR